MYNCYLGDEINKYKYLRTNVLRTLDPLQNSKHIVKTRPTLFRMRLQITKYMCESIGFNLQKDRTLYRCKEMIKINYYTS